MYRERERERTNKSLGWLGLGWLCNCLLTGRDCRHLALFMGTFRGPLLRRKSQNKINGAEKEEKQNIKFIGIFSGPPVRGSLIRSLCVFI